VAYAASVVGADAKVVMQATANPARIAATKAVCAEVLIEPDGAAAFARAEALVAEEARFFVHPFEGPRVTEATAGVALELIEDAGALDAIVVAIGGGGLAGGVAAAAKQLLPACAVYGVEPEGAAVMSRSLEAGRPLTLDHLDTIADSLAPPMTTPYAFATCRHHLDDVVVVSDDQMAAAAALLFTERKLAVEPAGAAAAAAAFGPLRQRLAGKRIGLIVCGANIDRESFCSLIARGEAALGAGVLAAGS
jgi:threonine dehydratase